MNVHLLSLQYCVNELFHNDHVLSSGVVLKLVTAVTLNCPCLSFVLFFVPTLMINCSVKGLDIAGPPVVIISGLQVMHGVNARGFELDVCVFICVLYAVSMEF